MPYVMQGTNMSKWGLIFRRWNVCQHYAGKITFEEVTLP